MVCFSTCYPLLPNRAFKLSESFLNGNTAMMAKAVVIKRSKVVFKNRYQWFVN